MSGSVIRNVRLPRAPSGGTWSKFSDLHGLDKFVRLRRLVLYGNGLEDISPLAGCTALEELDLRFNKVRDLSPLYGCKELKLLEIGGNGALDPDEIRRLQEALPACTIVTRTRERKNRECRI